MNAGQKISCLPDTELRLDAELGYGIAGPFRLGTATPHAGLGLADGGTRALGPPECAGRSRPKSLSGLRSGSGSEMGCRDGPKRPAGAGLRHQSVRPTARVAPGPKSGGHRTLRCASPRVRVGDYVWVDPNEPAAHCRLVAVRDPGRGGESVVTLLIERDGRRALRELDGRCPERTVDAGNETDIRGVVVLVGNTV